MYRRIRELREDNDLFQKEINGFSYLVNPLSLCERRGIFLCGKNDACIVEMIGGIGELPHFILRVRENTY